MKRTKYFITRGIIMSFAYILFASIVSCSEEEVEPQKLVSTPFELIDINNELLKGEWIYKDSSSKYCRISLDENNSFNVSDVNYLWDAGSLNTPGSWNVNGNELTGSYTYRIKANDNSPQKKTVRIKIADQKKYSITDDNGVQYKKLLGEIKLRRGETVIPECLPAMQQTVINKVVTPFETRYEAITSDVVTSLISSDSRIVSVDSKSGAVTGSDYGMAFVDVVTQDGTASIKIVVDDDFTSLIGKTRKEIKDIYGTSNIMVEDFSQLTYNMEGEFACLKIEFVDGVVFCVVPIFREGVKIVEDKYLNYYKKIYTHLADLSNTEVETFVNAPTWNEATILVRLMRSSNIGGATASYMYYGKPNKFANPMEVYLYDTSFGLGKTSDEIKEICGDNISASQQDALLYRLYGSYANYIKSVGFAFDSDGKCKTALNELQPYVQESDIHDVLSRKYEFYIKTDNSYWYYTKDRLMYVLYKPANNNIGYMYRDLWDDLTKYFGKSDMDVYNDLTNKFYYEYIDSYSYEDVIFEDDYDVIGNYYVDKVAFEYFTDNIICEIVLLLKTEHSKENVLKYLRRIYAESIEDCTDDLYVFYDNTRQIKIQYSNKQSAIVFSDMNLLGLKTRSLSQGFFFNRELFKPTNRKINGKK